nr:oligosaccharide flippase family protein [Bradyrhizobium zhengyangense]
MWSLGGFALTLVLRLGSNLLMTRILAPEMFGVMAIASAVITGLAMFSDLGLKQNIVQSRRGQDAVFLNTAWTLQIVRGFAISTAAILVCFAIFAVRSRGWLPLDSVYADPSLPYVVGALSLWAAIAGFESTKLFEASREILLARITSIEILTQIFGVLCMLAWAVFDRSIWALVVGTLSSAVLRAFLSHVLLPGNSNRLEWEGESVHELLGFGKWIMLASVIGFVVNSGDRLLLAGMVDATVLGFYAIASLFVGSIEGVLARLMTDVSFPALSEIVRTRRATLKQNYYRFLTVIAGGAYLASGVLMTFGGTLVDVLYDRRYHDAGWMLELTSAILLTIPFRLATQSFLALGVPHLQSYILVFRLLSLVGGTSLGFRWYGTRGALIGIVFSHFSYLPVIVYYNIKHRLFDLRIEVYLMAIFPIGILIGKVAAKLVEGLF